MRTQHQRARALVAAQLGISRAGRAVFVDRFDVAFQRIQHACGNIGTKAVQHIGLLQGNHVGVQRVALVAIGTRPGLAAWPRALKRCASSDHQSGTQQTTVEQRRKAAGLANERVKSI